MKIRNCSPRFTRFSALLSISLAVLILFAGEAAAFLHRAGPINPAPSVGNFPAWYQDTTGLTLEFCDPKNDAELDGGFCLLARDAVGAPGVLSVPETFPTNFVDEHFWYAADAIPVSTNPLVKRAILVLAVEAAFGADVTPGGQIAFSRIRIRLDDVPVTGTYRFIHPYGEDIVEGVAGERIFVTDDVGIACAPGDFSCALTSRLGPFLLPSDTPGGTELPAVVGPAPDNNLYIADPGRSGPVTGSTLPNFIDSTGASRNHNIFRIEGPEGSDLDGAGNDYIETINFALMGRIFTGALPGEVTVDRANYARNNAGQKVEVFATGFETTQGRLPGEDPAPAVMPVLSFFDAPCASALDNNLDPIPPFSAPVGAAETRMFNAGNSFWAQNTRIVDIPVSVCVKDNVSLTYFLKTVGDEITISEAYFDPNAQSLSVKARSSDELALPTLTLGGFADLANGAILVSPLAAPPAHVHVNSAAGGSNSLQVTTTPSPPVAPLPATGATLTASLSSPQNAGASILFTATAAGGSGSYQYRFVGRKIGTTPIFEAQPYGSLNTWTWNTTTVAQGIYEFQVYARSVGSTAPVEAVSEPLIFSIVIQGVDNVSLAPAPASPQNVGAGIVFTATPTGGTAPIQYQFWGKVAGAATFSLAQGYSTSNSFTWNTGTVPAGNYEWQVFARSAGSTAVSEAVSAIVPYTLTVDGVDNVSLAPDLGSPQSVGAGIVFTATPTGGTAPVQYQFWGRVAGAATFSLAQGYSTSNTFTWNTGTVPAGNYEWQVFARSAGSTAVSEAVSAIVPYTLTVP